MAPTLVRAAFRPGWVYEEKVSGQRIDAAGLAGG